MQIFLHNATGRVLLPLENSSHSVLLYNNKLLVNLSDHESVKIESTNREETFSEKGEYTFPIIWNSENRCTCIIRQNNSFLKYVFHLDNSLALPEEDKVNLLKFANQLESTFCLDKIYNVQELVNAIKADKVSLIIEMTPYVGYDDQSLLKDIAETVPMIMDICSHPKQSLRTEEAILDVNLVKRINSRTMDHLASHSEHWKSRTLNGLIPNRLRADIFEDDINIYENLFFRMAVDDVLKYIHHQVVSIEKTIVQNDNAIDWNAYGETLVDYKRMRIFQQLLPAYDIREKQDVNKVLSELLFQWQKLERNFSTVEASQFYRSINKKRHISRNIQLTNILKKDSRYNALYRVWCEIQRRIVQEHQDSLSTKDGNDININDSYSMYVIVLLLYVFNLMEFQMEEGSTFSIGIDGAMKVNAYFKSDNMEYIVTSDKNAYATHDIHVDFIERNRFDYHLPTKVLGYIDEIRKVLPAKAALNEDENVISFYAKPANDEQRELKNVFHLSNTKKKGLSEEEKNSKEEADKIWRPELEHLFSSGYIHDPKRESIIIKPQCISIGTNEVAVEHFTTAVLNSTNGFCIYTFPIDLGVYKKSVRSNRLINRLLNYGEKYYEEDAGKWGDYRAGILPIAQSEINSAQRLMKLISVHSARLQIKWNSQHAVCPICGSDNCQEDGENSWRCRNPECEIIFGITKHADGCGEKYEWTRPYVNIKKKDIGTENHLELLLRKELIFDRLVITDFEFEDQEGDSVRYIPICPKCGKRTFSY